MNNTVPAELKYTKTHEWARLDEDGVVTVGITHHAQALLGDMVHVEFPEEGEVVQVGDEVGVVESVKAAADIYSPLSGEVTSVNSHLNDAPELINRDPYGEGWLFKLRSKDEHALKALLDAEEYKKLLESEAY